MRWTARRSVGVLLVLLAAYVWLVGVRARLLLAQDGLAPRLIGAGIVMVSLVGVVVVVGDVRFGLATARLARAYGAAPEPAGFDVVRAAVEAAPDDWRGWYRLALAYDAGRDVRRARAAMRHAIRLHQAGRNGSN